MSACVAPLASVLDHPSAVLASSALSPNRSKIFFKVEFTLPLGRTSWTDKKSWLKIPTYLVWFAIYWSTSQFCEEIESTCS